MNALRAHPDRVFHHPNKVHVPHVHIPRSEHWVVDHPRAMAWLLTGMIVLLVLFVFSIIQTGLKTGTWPLWAG